MRGCRWSEQNPKSRDCARNHEIMWNMKDFCWGNCFERLWMGIDNAARPVWQRIDRKFLNLIWLVECWLSCFNCQAHNWIAIKAFESKQRLWRGLFWCQLHIPQSVKLTDWVAAIGNSPMMSQTINWWQCMMVRKYSPVMGWGLVCACVWSSNCWSPNGTTCKCQTEINKTNSDKWGNKQCRHRVNVRRSWKTFQVYRSCCYSF